MSYEARASHRRQSRDEAAYASAATAIHHASYSMIATPSFRTVSVLATHGDEVIESQSTSITRAGVMPRNDIFQLATMVVTIENVKQMILDRLEVALANTSVEEIPLTSETVRAVIRGHSQLQRPSRVIIPSTAAFRAEISILVQKSLAIVSTEL